MKFLTLIVKTATSETRVTKATGWRLDSRRLRVFGVTADEKTIVVLEAPRSAVELIRVEAQG